MLLAPPLWEDLGVPPSGSGGVLGCRGSRPSPPACASCTAASGVCGQVRGTVARSLLLTR